VAASEVVNWLRAFSVLTFSPRAVCHYEMRAWLLDDFTGLGALRLAEVPDPQPGPNEVVLAVKFAGLNPADRYLAERQYPLKPALPHILGRDGMGTILALGSGVKGLEPGMRRLILRSDIGGTRPGTFAEKVAVPVEDLAEIPAGWTDEEAAGAALVYMTAFQALTMWGPLAAASLVLVTGASGGVGVASVHLAAAMGCTVIGLSRDAEKSRKLLASGASAVFNPANPDWRKELKQHFAPRRVTLAVDNIGGKLLPEVIDTLGDQGKVSAVGRLAGPVPEFNTATLFFRRIRIGGVAVGAYTNAETREVWGQVLALLAKSAARPLVDSVFPLDQLLPAFDRLAKGPMGKVLLRGA
jgi:NADPH2:quinone reductase